MNKARLLWTRKLLGSLLSGIAAFAGFELARGKLGADLRLRLDGQKLDAANVVRLDRLTFGERYFWRCLYTDTNGHPSPPSQETSFLFGGAAVPGQVASMRSVTPSRKP